MTTRSLGAALLSGGLLLLAAAAPAAAEGAADWSGFYIGVHLGTSWGEVDYAEPQDPPFDFTDPIDGVAGGLYAGYAWQIGNAVLGLEVDGALGDLSAAAEDPVYNDYSVVTLQWNAHLRAKAGWAVDRWQVFAAGGLALAGLEVDDSDPGWGRDAGTRVGWTLGGGLAVAVTPGLRLQAEYLYDDYGTLSGEIEVPSSTTVYDVKAGVTAHTLRIGLAWQF